MNSSEAVSCSVHVCMQDDLQSLQMQLVQRQMAEPGLALSPALLFGDPTLWGEDPKVLSLLRDVAYGQGTCTILWCNRIQYI